MSIALKTGYGFNGYGDSYGDGYGYGHYGYGGYGYGDYGYGGYSYGYGRGSNAPEDILTLLELLAYAA